jgi:hypothetical protein
MLKEVNEMRMKKTITVTAATLALSGAALGGIAIASSDGTGSKADNVTTPVSVSRAASTENATADTDDVQEGNQTGPERTDANEVTETGSESEGAESDGPGGHEDPPGNGDHEFDGEE